MALRSLPLLAVLAACAPALPSLPDREGQAQLVELRVFELSEDGVTGEVVPEGQALWAGALYRLQIAVTDDSGRPMEGQSVSLRLESLRPRIFFHLPGGTSCVTEAGSCQLDLVSTGVTGAVDLLLRANTVEARRQVEVAANAADAGLRIRLGQELIRWRPGEPDPLAGLESLLLAGDEPGGRPLELRLEDAFGNGVTGQPITVAVQLDSVDRLALLQPVAGDDPEARCQAASEAGSAELLSDESGLVLFCLAGGQTGTWEARLQAGTITGEAGFLLAGITVAGRPRDLMVEGLEGDPPVVSCAPGERSDLVTVRVLDGAGRGVPGVQLSLSVSHGLSAPEPSTTSSDQEGRALVAARCGQDSLQEGRLVVEVPSEGLRREIRVQPRSGVIQRLEAQVLAGEQAQWRQVRAGESLQLAVRALDHFDQPVLGASIQWVVPDHTQIHRVAQAGQSCAPGDDAGCLHGLSQESDAQGLASVDLELSGPRTGAAPVVIQARGITAQGQRLVLPFEVHLTSGPPAVLRAEPGGEVAAVLGAYGGRLRFRLVDVAENGVSGETIQLEVPEALVLSAESGSSDGDGYFSTDLLDVLSEGDHLLTARVGDLTAEVTVSSVATLPRELTLRWRAAEGETWRHLPQLDGNLGMAQRVTTPMPVSLQVTVKDANAVPLARRGLTAELVDGEGCGQFEGELVTGEGGELILGVGGTADHRAGSRRGLCLWRLAAGAAQALLVIDQRPGSPRGGTVSYRVAEGDDLLWLPLPQPHPSLQANGVIPGPGTWADMNQTLHLRIAVEDSYGNSLAGELVRIIPENAYAQPGQVVLGDDGAFDFKLAGGPDVRQDAGFELLTAMNWLDPPSPRFTVVMNRPSLQTIRPDAVMLTAKPAPNEELWVRLEVDPGTLFFPDDLWDRETGLCDDENVCSYVQLWHLDDGWQVVPDGDQQLETRYPLRRIFDSAYETSYYMILLPMGDLSRGGVHGITVETPGFGDQPAQKSAIAPLQTPYQPRWEQHEQLIVPPGDGAPSLRQALMVDLNDDGHGELVLCGVDDSGGWVHVVTPTDQGETAPLHSAAAVPQRVFSVLEDGATAPRPPWGAPSCAVVSGPEGHWLLMSGQPASVRNPQGELLSVPLSAAAPFFEPEQVEALPLSGALPEAEPLYWWRLGLPDVLGNRPIEGCTADAAVCPEASRFRSTLQVQAGGRPVLVQEFVAMETELVTAVEAQPFDLEVNGNRWSEYCDSSGSCYPGQDYPEGRVSRLRFKGPLGGGFRNQWTWNTPLGPWWVRGEEDRLLVARPILPVAGCGNGRVQGGEDCDDGNRRDDDGCIACGFARCGDGLWRRDLGPEEIGFEACDDGNDVDNDYCSNNCQLPSCGDGLLSAHEVCDDGNDIEDDGCNNCRLSSCGDGEVDEGEDCDDGNENDQDGCRNNCREHACGDGVLRTDETGTNLNAPGYEECDDGNPSPEDGCGADCRHVFDGITGSAMLRSQNQQAPIIGSDRPLAAYAGAIRMMSGHDLVCGIFAGGEVRCSGSSDRTRAWAGCRCGRLYPSSGALGDVDPPIVPHDNPVTLPDLPPIQTLWMNGHAGYGFQNIRFIDVAGGLWFQGLEASVPFGVGGIEVRRTYPTRAPGYRNIVGARGTNGYFGDVLVWDYEGRFFAGRGAWADAEIHYMGGRRAVDVFGTVGPGSPNFTLLTPEGQVHHRGRSWSLVNSDPSIVRMLSGPLGFLHGDGGLSWGERRVRKPWLRKIVAVGKVGAGLYLLDDQGRVWNQTVAGTSAQRVVFPQ